MRRTALLLVLPALLLAGCSDDEDDAEEAATTTTGAGSTTTAGGAPTTPPTGTLGAVACGSVGFTPDSDDVAGEINATGLTCEEAREFVLAAGPRTSAVGPREVTVNGYRCVMTHSEDDPLPAALYECENGERRVTFVRT